MRRLNLSSGTLRRVKFSTDKLVVKDSQCIIGTVPTSLFRVGSDIGPVKVNGNVLRFNFEGSKKFNFNNVDSIRAIFKKENKPWLHGFGEHNYGGLSTFDSLNSITKDSKHVWSLPAGQYIPSNLALVYCHEKYNVSAEGEHRCTDVRKYTANVPFSFDPDVPRHNHWMIVPIEAMSADDYDSSLREWVAKAWVRLPGQPGTRSSESSEPHMKKNAAFMEGILIAALYDFIITSEPIAIEDGDHDLQQAVYYAGHWRKLLLDAHEKMHHKSSVGGRQVIALSRDICGILFEVCTWWEAKMNADDYDCEYSADNVHLRNMINRRSVNI